MYRHSGLGALAVLVLGLAACTPQAGPPAPVGGPATTAPQPTVAKPPAAAAATGSAGSPSPAITAPVVSPAAAASVGSSPVPAAAFDEQAVASFYRGKTIRIVVGFSTGGGYDLYARLISRYLGKYIPGNPLVIVENMPGAGGNLATNNIYNALPKDGTVIGSFIGTTILQQLFGDKTLQYDMTKFQYIGAPTGDHYVMELAKGSGFNAFSEALGPNSKQLVMGGMALACSATTALC